MYLLYHAEDEMPVKFLWASPELEKLEEKKAELEVESKQFEALGESWAETHGKYYDGLRQQVKDFLLRNMDAIREFCLHSWTEKAEGFDWKTTAFNPGASYTDKVILERRLKIIDSVSRNDWHYFQKGKDPKWRNRFMKRLFWLDKLTEPLLELDGVPPKFDAKAPEPYYRTGSLFIEKLNVLEE